jgi:hypothetical protein
MIVFFNETICILLIVAITIIFIKTIYSHRQYTENFEPQYYGLTDPDNIADRLLKDPDILNKFSVAYKNEYNSKVGQAEAESSKALEYAKDINNFLVNLPEKYNNTLSKYEELINSYNNKRMQIEKNLVKKINDGKDMNDFNSDNLRLRNKIREFTNSLEEVQLNLSSYKDGMILKNIATDYEITLVKNQNSGDFSKYIILNDINKHFGHHDIYYLSLNGGCLQSNSKGNISNAPCTKKTMEQFFLAFLIKNNDMYNKYIRLSGNFQNHHLVDVMDNSINYPFYIISPFNIPGYAVLLDLNSKIYIKPIRNDPFQRFLQTPVSSFCQINNND